MENTPAEAPISAPAETSVATPQTSNEPAQAPAPAPAPSVDLGLSPEQAQKFKTFIENSGGFDNAFSKLKTDVSTPKSLQPTPEQSQPTSQPQTQPEVQYKAPEGSITAREFLAQQYFQSLSHDQKYAAISEQIASGEVLKDMAAFNIQPLNQDGSINDRMVRQYLDLKAQTVPAKATGSEPNASVAPTVEYVPVADGGITSMEQAYAVLDQDMRLKAQGLAGHPAIQAAEEYIKAGGKPAKK